MIKIGITGRQVWSESGNCALFKCVKSGNIHGIDLLLTHNPEDIERKQLPSLTTPIGIAFESNQLDVVTTLLKFEPENVLYYWLRSKHSSDSRRRSISFTISTIFLEFRFRKNRKPLEGKFTRERFCFT